MSLDTDREVSFSLSELAAAHAVHNRKHAELHSPDTSEERKDALRDEMDAGVEQVRRAL